VVERRWWRWGEVKALYAAAGLSLDQDLDTLESAQRISADPSAVGYLTRNLVFNGELGDVPVLTLHTTGDGLVLNQDEQAYALQRPGASIEHAPVVGSPPHCTERRRRCAGSTIERARTSSDGARVSVVHADEVPAALRPRPGIDYGSGVANVESWETARAPFASRLRTR
jgi:hypothetical protein